MRTASTPTEELNWNLRREDAQPIELCVNRAMKLSREHNLQLNRMTLEMDLVSLHLNGTPINFRDMAVGTHSDFLHDILGIRRHLDRSTAQLRDCFVPRFAVRK